VRLISRSPFVVSILGAFFLYANGVAQTPSISQNDDLSFRKLTHTDKKGYKMPYRLYVPQGYDAQKKYPLIFWFHGGTGRGFDNAAQISGSNEKGTHIWTTIQNQSQFPALVLAPQCPENENWSDPELNEIGVPLQAALDILAVVQKDYAIDTDRIYLAGQSMGGLGVWALLQAYPEKWAGAVVLASFDNFTNTRGLARVPVWIFQGEADMTVPVGLVREMVKQLKKAGGQPRYTEYRKAGHDVWEKAFAEPELLPWLAAQKRGK